MIRAIIHTVCVRKHNVWRLAAELKRNALQVRLGCRCCDNLSDFRAASESHLVDARVFRDGGAGRRPETGNHGNNAGRESRLI